jgi:hypothetical protein
MDTKQSTRRNLLNRVVGRLHVLGLFLAAAAALHLGVVLDGTPRF